RLHRDERPNDPIGPAVVSSLTGVSNLLTHQRGEVLMPKRIPLTKGMFTLIDDADCERVNLHKWRAHRSRNTWYAVRNGPGRKMIFLHRFISDAPEGLIVDHVNGDGLDNRRENLRLCTHAENARNRQTNRNNTSGYKGV